MDRPILSVPSKALTKLVYALTVDSPLDPPRDWRGLAGYLGFPHRVITLIEQHRESSKAWHVLKLWEQTGTSSVGKLLIALMELNMKECLDILRSELGGKTGIAYGSRCEFLVSKCIIHRYDSFVSDAYLQYEKAEQYLKQLKSAGSDAQKHLFKPLREEDLELYPEMNGEDSDGETSMNMERFYTPIRKPVALPLNNSGTYLFLHVR